MEILKRTFSSRRWARRFGWAVILCVIASLLEAETPREYDVKGVLLFNLTQFVEWPPANLGDAGDPFVIGIFGHDPFDGQLDAVVREERVHGRRIVVERVRTFAAARRCHLLFISASERGDLPALLENLAHRPILTVGDFDGFVQRGGMVQFYRTAENKIRLRVNLPATRQSQLTMSAKLLRVAELSSPDKG